MSEKHIIIMASISTVLAEQIFKYFKSTLEATVEAGGTIEDLLVEEKLDDIEVEMGIMIGNLVNKSKLSKRKVTKDPNAPKRPKNAYMFFQQAVRTEVSEELQEQLGKDFKQPAVAKEVGRRWRELCADDKVKFEEQAAKDKKRYAKEYAAYTPAPGFEKKVVADPTKPKGAKSAWGYFQQEEKAAAQQEIDALVTEAQEAGDEEFQKPKISDILRKKWDELKKLANKKTAAGKKAHARMESLNKKATEDKERHTEEMAQWREENDIATCDYVFNTGKRQGEPCGRVCAEGMDKCTSHMPPDEENGCQYKITRGVREGQMCGKKTKVGHDLCSNHLSALKAAHEKKANTGKNKKSAKGKSAKKAKQASKKKAEIPDELEEEEQGENWGEEGEDWEWEGGEEEAEEGGEEEAEEGGEEQVEEEDEGEGGEEQVEEEDEGEGGEEQAEEEDEGEEVETCQFVPTRGKTAGQACGKEAMKGTDRCKAHKNK